VIKIALAFSKSFWKEDMGFVLSNEIIPTWWTQLPDTTPVLTGWVGGPPANDLSGNKDEEIMEKALLSLSAIFDRSVQSIRQLISASVVINWQKNEWSSGAYSYDTLFSKTAKALLNTPLADTLFFAGEGLYEGRSPGTVEAAIVSAKDVAKRIPGYGWKM
jgi:monoamine oxidase